MMAKKGWEREREIRLKKKTAALSVWTILMQPLAFIKSKANMELWERNAEKIHVKDKRWEKNLLFDCWIKSL